MDPNAPRHGWRRGRGLRFRPQREEPYVSAGRQGESINNPMLAPPTGGGRPFLAYGDCKPNVKHARVPPSVRRK